MSRDVAGQSLARCGWLIPMLAGMALIGGCSTRPYARVDPRACSAEGGVVRDVGMFATPACVKPYLDAGKACRGKLDCQGACLAGHDAVIGEATTGTCQKDTHDIFGCQDTVEDGRAAAGTCWD